MPPPIALFLCVIFIVCIFIMDFKRKPDVSPALWIPLIWMMIIGSRFVSQWFDSGARIDSPQQILEGSPIDRVIFLILIVCGLVVLWARKIHWSRLIEKNSWVFLLFFYAALSILWSEFQFVAFKRWIKALGNFIMILIVLTDPSPVEAVKTIIRRCAYVLIPLSIVLIKYYPDLGRSYSPWTGEPTYLGVTTHKNELGTICSIFGIFFLWNYLSGWRNNKVPIDKKELLLYVIFFLMITWLLKMADSATSLMCLILGICLLIMTEFPVMRRNLIFLEIYVFFGFLFYVLLQVSFDVQKVIVSYLGRDMTLTGRFELWKELLVMVTNPFIGTGYESFWLGNRAEKLWDIYFWHPNQAHNGYLETYLNLGFLGLLLLIGVIGSVWIKTKKTLVSEWNYGRFRITILIVALFYNITEAGFMGIHPIWFMFLLSGVEIPSTPGDINDKIDGLIRPSINNRKSQSKRFRNL